MHLAAKGTGNPTSPKLMRAAMDENMKKTKMTAITILMVFVVASLGYKQLFIGSQKAEEKPNRPEIPSTQKEACAKHRELGDQFYAIIKMPTNTPSEKVAYEKAKAAFESARAQNYMNADKYFIETITKQQSGRQMPPPITASSVGGDVIGNKVTRLVPIGYANDFITRITSRELDAKTGRATATLLVCNSLVFKVIATVDQGSVFDTLGSAMAKGDNQVYQFSGIFYQERVDNNSGLRGVYDGISDAISSGQRKEDAGLTLRVTDIKRQ